MAREKEFQVSDADGGRVAALPTRVTSKVVQLSKGTWDFFIVTIVAALAVGYLAGRGSLTLETAVAEKPFRDRQSFSALDWSIEDFELKFEEQYTALIRTINEQTNWEIAQRGPYHRWIEGQQLPESRATQEQFKAEFEERLKSNRGEWRKLLENTVGHLKGSFALQRAEVDLLTFYDRLGMTNEFVGLYQELIRRPARTPGLSPFTRRYRALIAEPGIGNAVLATQDTSSAPAVTQEAF